MALRQSEFDSPQLHHSSVSALWRAMIQIRAGVRRNNAIWGASGTVPRRRLHMLGCATGGRPALHAEEAGSIPAPSTIYRTGSGRDLESVCGRRLFRSADHGVRA